MDQDNYGAYQLYALSGTTLFLAICNILCRAKIGAIREALLPNAYVGHLFGLTRGDLEDAAMEMTKWKCGICAFFNTEDKNYCMLCETNRAVFLLAVPEFTDCENTIAIETLNMNQRSAWERKHWTREIDEVGEPFWKSSLDITTEQFIIQSNNLVYNSQVSLRFTEIDSKSAGKTLLGDDIQRWWFPNLADLRNQNFSIKYAWLLSQIALSYTGYCKISVSRDELFAASLRLLLDIADDENLCTKTKITLIGESAIDAGGVGREWYTLLTMAVFQEEKGLFLSNKDDQSFFINPNSAKDHGPDHLDRFHAIGRLLGRAIVDGQVLPFHFSIPLFKAILGHPLSMEDIRYLDPTVYNSLKYVQEAEDVDNLALTFSVSLDEITEIDIIPNGRNIEVTNANKNEYVKLMVKYLLFDRTAPQLEKLVQGLYDILPQELLMPFDYKELELFLCGFSDIDVADWKASTNATTSLEPILPWFWEIVENDMSSADRGKLLQFTTGSSRVPLQGFRGLTSQDGRLCPFTLYAIPYVKGVFPKVHSCFNRIDLPVYPTIELMREGLFALSTNACGRPDGPFLNMMNRTLVNATAQVTILPPSNEYQPYFQFGDLRTYIPSLLMGLLLLIMYGIYYRSSRQQALLPNDHVGHLHGLKRDALEDPTLEAEKWTCNICEFRNAQELKTCMLCRSDQAIHILVSPEFTNMPGVISFDQLNALQRSARLRNQWKRSIVQDNELGWSSSIPITEQHYVVAASEPGEIQLQLALWSSAYAKQTIHGEEINPWWIEIFAYLEPLGFSLKYAWLIHVMSESFVGFSKLKIYRSDLLEESIHLLRRIPMDQVCARTQITLLGESGIDAGGVTREWYTLLTDAIFEEKLGLFIVNPSDQSYFINPNSKKYHGEEHLLPYHAIGRLLGRAIIDGQVLPFHFSTPLFKIILGYPVSMDDVLYLDETVYNSLRYIQNAAEVDSLTLTFSVSVDEMTEVDLVPNGRNIPVVDANKVEYVERMVRYLLFERVANQLEMLLQGLYEVLPQELLIPFDYKELELMLCGSSEIDVADWKRSTNVSKSLENVVEWFWDVVENDLTHGQREKLLQFTTGSSRVPLQGFKGLTGHNGNLCPFSLHGISYSRGAFPRVHSCFNRIDLPIYPTRELLREGIFVLVNMEIAEFTIA